MGWNIERLSHRTRRPIGGYRVLGGAGQKEVQQGESHPVRARRPRKLEEHMAKATKKKRPQVAEAFKAKTPVEKISKQMKRSVGALRQQALKLGIGLGHRR